jgi:nitrogen fixation protein FixH
MGGVVAWNASDYEVRETKKKPVDYRAVTYAFGLPFSRAENPNDLPFTLELRLIPTRTSPYRLIYFVFSFSF